MRRRFSPWLVWGAKLAVGVAIFAFVVRQVGPAQWDYLRQHKLIAVIPVLGWALNQLCTSMRLHVMLQALNINVCRSSVLKANFASLFLGNLMPGSIGADLVKFFYVRSSDGGVPSSKLAFVLILDRVLGLCAILILCVVASLFIVIPDSAQSLFVYIPHVSLLLLAVVFVVGHFFVVKYVDSQTLPFIKKIFSVYLEMLPALNKRIIFLICFYNMAAVLVLVFSLVYVGGDLLRIEGMSSMYAEQFFLIPLSLVVAMLPLTPAGIGTVQVAMGFVYPLLYLPASVGIAVTTMSQLGLVLASMVFGLPFYLTARKG